MRKTTSFKFLLPIVLLGIFSSCGENAKEVAAFKEVEKALLESTKTLDKAAVQIVREFRQKLEDHSLKELAAAHLPALLSINAAKANASKQVDSLAELLSNDNRAMIAAQASRVYGLYLDTVFKTRPDLNDIPSIALSAKPEHKNYHSLPLVKLLLAKIKYHISHVNAEVVRYLDSRVAIGCGLSFDKTSVLVGQSSQVLMPGQELRITAGVGAFSQAAAATVSVNNQRIEMKENAIAETAFRVPAEPGNYTTPVDITYVNREGETKKERFTIEYKVVKGN
ncbi:MAG: hypothetical protein EOO13_17640 [Chitinophagaceae bacterium]|nr:MAG: hypothetical protein EOO13_17640 [Chitinophagaceae bacterium]